MTPVQLSETKHELNRLFYFHWIISIIIVCELYIVDQTKNAPFPSYLSSRCTNVHHFTVLMHFSILLSIFIVHDCNYCIYPIYSIGDAELYNLNNNLIKSWLRSMLDAWYINIVWFKLDKAPNWPEIFLVLDPADPGLTVTTDNDGWVLLVISECETWFWFFSHRLFVCSQ